MIFEQDASFLTCQLLNEPHTARRCLRQTTSAAAIFYRQQVLAIQSLSRVVFQDLRVLWFASLVR